MYHKQFLPTYGVFDEDRYFRPGSAAPVFRLGDALLGVNICEDIWYAVGPTNAQSLAGAELIVNINASPFSEQKPAFRKKMLATRASDNHAIVAYVNMVGGQDELVFDGDSLVVSPAGDVLARAPQFEEGLLVVDLDLPAASKQLDDRNETGHGAVERLLISADPLPSYAALPAGIAPRLEDEAEVYAALVTGVRDYVAKNGFTTVVIALSGGIDSALTAAIACDAVGAANVHGVSMPSSYSSEHSKSDAADLAERTGLHFQTVPIAPMVGAYLAAIELTGLAEENLQARVRGTALMGLSNQHGHLVLAPGNKSELAVGYSTLYGDAVGGYAPLKDVPKTLVWQLARWRNKDAEARGETSPIPEASISKPPSAELRPGQLDTDSLPEYEQLDEVIDLYVERDRGSSELVAAGFDQALVERVLKMTDTAEYKRRQYPPGPKISFKAFGRDRRLPITNRWREHLPRPPSS
jgi:NAD+ synthase (glutamine-hydrolysing)